MKHYLSFVLLLFCVTGSFAQEVCNNAIDDDSDGLIDLNDPDCTCNESVAIPSLIPNPSFEEFVYCPTTYSQLDGAADWIQATGATTDYLNSCGFVGGLNMAPFPDGNAIVGSIFMQGWQEYLGACLNSPMLAGTNYELQFNIASKPENGQLEIGNLGQVYYGDIDITLFGAENCASLPVSTFGCPQNSDPSWFVLGTAHYTPVNEWGILTINFTPSVNVNSIILGSPCNLPADYVGIINENGYADPYFLFDNLLLNQSEFFNGVTVALTGNFCTDNVVIESTLIDPAPGNYTYQWYNNGIAIIGATGPDYAVADYNAAASYAVVVTDGENCFISNAISLSEYTPPAPIVTSPVVYCQLDVASPLTVIGNNTLWYTAPTGGVGTAIAPTPLTTSPGSTNYYVSQTCGSESTRAVITVTVNPSQIPDFQPFDPVCPGGNLPSLDNISPNGISGFWTPDVVNPNQSGSYVFAPISTDQCAQSQTLEIIIASPLAFDIIGGCIQNSYILEAIPASGSFDGNVSFQWLDPNGSPIGTDEPTINMTTVINGTIAEEEFPLTYGLNITDANGCTYFDDFTIERVFCTIPKGVSVNGDSDNDFFNLDGLNVKHLDIYNRYGMIVYSLDNYTAQWRGQSDSGKDLPDGTYYYYLTFENESPKSGWVYLINKQ